MKQFSGTVTVGNGMMLGQFFLDALRRAMAVREIEGKPQTVLFEEHIPSIDTSKMERIDGQSSGERRITDNVFRFMSVFVGDRRFVVDLPNTVLAPNDAKRLLPRGFEVDVECSFQPLQRFYDLSQVDEVAADLTFVWLQLWLMRSFPKVDIYTY